MDDLVRHVHVLTNGMERAPRDNEPFLIVERVGTFEYTWTCSEFKPPGEWTRCGTGLDGSAEWIRLAREPITESDKNFFW
jgi:hypothetical protein